MRKLTDCKAYTVYKHTTPCGKVYIGITGRPVERRWQNGKNYKTSVHFDNAIKKYGWENINHAILYTGLSKEDAERLEIKLIAEYKSSQSKYGYNIRRGGNLVENSEETNRKISAALKGKHYKKRRNHTPEEKKAISEKLKGRTSPMKGRHWTASQRARVGTPILCLDTNEVFYSMHEAARKTGLDRKAIVLCCKGVYKQTGGLHFAIVN